MSAPRRWKDSPDAPTGVRELLSAARPTRAIPEATFARGVAKVAQRTAVPVAAVTAVGLWTKIAIASVALVAVTGSVVGVRAITVAEAERQAHDETPSQRVVVAVAPKKAVLPPEPEAPVPAPIVAAASVQSASVQSAGVQSAHDASPRMRPAIVQAAVVPSAEVRPTDARVAEPDAPAAEPVAPAPAAKREASTLVEELSLLEAAQKAVARDPSRALASVAQHRARFPTGMLGAERDLVELDALSRLGRTDEAKSRADAWLAREPAGVYAQRVKAIRATLK